MELKGSHWIDTDVTKNISCILQNRHGKVHDSADTVPDLLRLFRGGRLQDGMISILLLLLKPAADLLKPANLWRNRSTSPCFVFHNNAIRRPKQKNAGTQPFFIAPNKDVTQTQTLIPNSLSSGFLKTSNTETDTEIRIASNPSFFLGFQSDPPPQPKPFQNSEPPPLPPAPSKRRSNARGNTLKLDATNEMHCRTFFSCLEDRRRRRLLDALMTTWGEMGSG
ncbi:hypothetical protein H6P81_002471 [Aristolochia fimbriata]|uniref:Uncharacterized protein n=1 Tax=Aristolochia fimbriata TaxID=158543 RepID=A0AAV7FAJ3_ARIFI|nr:hypothetical protein H6P81_002471 [Aristolochia fimbriata]